MYEERECADSLEARQNELRRKSSRLRSLLDRVVNENMSHLDFGNSAYSEERDRLMQEKEAISWIGREMSSEGVRAIAQKKVEDPRRFIRSMHELVLRTTGGRAYEESLSLEGVAKLREYEKSDGVGGVNRISVDEILETSRLTRELYAEIGDAIFKNLDSKNISVSIDILNRDILAMKSRQPKTPYGRAVSEMLDITNATDPEQIQKALSEDSLGVYAKLDSCLNNLEMCLSDDGVVSEMQVLLNESQAEEIENEVGTFLGIVYRLRILREKVKNVFEASRGSGDQPDFVGEKEGEDEQLVENVVNKLEEISGEELVEVNGKKGTGSNFARGVGLVWDTWQKFFDNNETISANRLIILARKMQREFDTFRGSDEERYRHEIAVEKKIWDSDLTEDQRREIFRAFNLDASRQRANSRIIFSMNPQKMFMQTLEKVARILNK